MLVLFCYYNFFHCSCETYMFSRPNANVVFFSVIVTNAIISKWELVKELTLKCKTSSIRCKLKVYISFKVCRKNEINKFFWKHSAADL